MHDVVSLGNPLMDVLIDVEEEFLKECNLVKGNMHLVDEETITKIEDKLDQDKIKLAPGGSEANTIAALAMLGRNVVLFGKIGQDDHGDKYKSALTNDGVISKVVQTDGMTGRSVAMITPDSERTMATHLGVAPNLMPTDFDEADIMQAKYLHLTAYLLLAENTKAAALKALEIAKNNNVKICFDLADPGVVAGIKDQLVPIVKDYADIVIANAEEAKAFTGKEPEDAIVELGNDVEIAVVKKGADGSLILDKNGLVQVQGFKVDAIDTTGAGDMYTAGFLYGLLNNHTLKLAGTVASFVAAKVVEIKGARLAKMPTDEIDQILADANN